MTERTRIDEIETQEFPDKVNFKTFELSSGKMIIPLSDVYINYLPNYNSYPKVFIMDGRPLVDHVFSSCPLCLSMCRCGGGASGALPCDLRTWKVSSSIEIPLSTPISIQLSQIVNIVLKTDLSRFTVNFEHSAW